MASSISDVLDDLNIETSSVTAREISAHCPFHEDSHPSFYMNVKSGLWICYQCGAKGTLPTLINLLAGEKVDPDTYLKDVRYETAREKAKPKRGKKSKEDPPLDPMVIEARYETFKEPPDWALESRMITRKAARRYGLRWDHGWIIPIWSPENVLWGWQFKRMDVVLNYPRAIKKSQTLFGLRELQYSSAALVESPLDVVRMAVVDMPALASFGAYVSKIQQRLLVDNLHEIWLALDNDTEGHKQSKIIYPGLSKRVATLMIDFPDGIKDPGDCTDDQVLEIFG